MADFFKKKGLTAAGVNKVICVIPDDTEISYMTASISLTNNTGEDGFVKIAISDEDEVLPEDWIDAGHALFAVTPDSTGLRFLTEEGDPLEHDEEEGYEAVRDFGVLTEDDDLTREAVVITDHGSSSRSPVLIGPSERIIVWSNISGISVRIAGLTQSKCGRKA